MRFAGSSKRGVRLFGGNNGLQVKVEDADEFLLESARSPLAPRKHAVMGQHYQGPVTVSSELFQIGINRICLCL